MTRAAEFERAYAFPFDDFQRRACDFIEDGSSVLVAAPTGAGKTVVGEFAAWMALTGGGKAFYTTPIKALSNQKYGDFLGAYGPDKVGLLTGDNSVNGDAPIVVMTTEVLRNMIYEDSRALEGLHYVVLDEVHYLQDPYRGAVWEEVLIHLPVDVQVVCLSATVSNAEEFADWVQTLRGHTEVIIEDKRPVDIRHWYFASDELLPMFVRRPDGELIANPRGRELDRRRKRGADRPGRGGRRPQYKRARIPWRTEVIERLDSEEMLPAIYFIFSRKGCDEAVRQCIRENLRLTTPDEANAVIEFAESRIADLPLNELDVLGYAEWIEGLRRGISAHHAGMIPPFKEAVEELFARGLIKAVFATETLALGINMPARTVVIENLMKFTGERHEQMTPGEYTQLSGRAGRRGIDELGHCVVLLQRFLPFDGITRLASTRTYPLVSSFRPSYNMAVNLVRNYDRAEAEHLVNSSFAQFQADRDVVKLERGRDEKEAYLASYRERMRCEKGDVEEYRQLADRLKRYEERRDGNRTRSTRINEAILKLRPGDVFEIRGGKRRGVYAVLEVTQKRSERRPRVLGISQRRSMERFVPADFRVPPTPVATVRVPKPFDVRDAQARRKVAHQLRSVQIDRPHDSGRAEADRTKEGKALRKAVENHPVHDCPELHRHLHFAERAERLRREISAIDRRVGRRTGTLARRFDQVLEVLRSLRYVDGWALTDKGETLTRVYNESDLLVVEAIERRLLHGLEPAELAAVCSSLVYEARGVEVEAPADMPTSASTKVWGDLMRLWRRVRREEDERGLELTREPDPGYAQRTYLWASGRPLEEVLGEGDAAGDFVRNMKQLIDLLRQL
ncbi:MAG: DEAD/DEAH box helicase, partial [Actinobacteria bacterium]|nr:DEAD/DEAH box helicase [Actinomycetota bacterium]